MRMHAVDAPVKAFGFLSFGHYAPARGSQTGSAADMIRQAVDLGVGADELGVNGAYFRVHHFAPQQAAPVPLLSAIAARTARIEVGTGVIDMRYENPLYLAEELAALDIISAGRIAIGVSRGSPEPALRGYEAFGYAGAEDPRGADLARAHFETFLRAIDGEGLAPADPRQAPAGTLLPIEPHSPGLRERIWWGSGTRATAEWTGRLGLNLMSSTLLTEATGVPFHELQRDQIDAYRAAYRDAGHTRPPRVSVSRSIFPIVNSKDAMYFGRRTDSDQIGIIDGFQSTFGKTYAAEPEDLVEQLRADSAVMAADTVMLTIPNQLGADYNLHILESFARFVAPELGWKPNTDGPVEGDPVA
ncbi:alkanesulfonate monooxygenase SsuD/methylene tetrahydromethanopterin reductase-like flavin-dependent oxidoreductase (luciferase family) [Sinomonas atrocyanea]|jgi:alkanesulfonate monooxygenase SsuD/methylene tetrahydromethanopterin reductase-like flavin-dependent oxidoreductase (luciferase family)|nr:alkanesulfonate monooxygenase SsuD/methylene tetrahydromethanopterin reductase-like flavin-dependent oxidoreductase (luciferase family) [Sinomonas atrocyanea]MDR6620111.1 alkanesulfonate monooxygenase SsuD/methylene tetrahydromethanopterin reductase-like flavin-dependent oxidoreductase (luciferase family) [Sinomonas atrocyanea]